MIPLQIQDDPDRGPASNHKVPVEVLVVLAFVAGFVAGLFAEAWVRTLTVIQ